MRCQCLDRGCIQDVLFRFGRLKTVLVISRSCSAHFLRSRRPLLLHLPTPSEPITHSQVWWSVPTLALKSPRRISVSARSVVETNLSFTHQDRSTLMMVAYLLPDKGSIIVIRAVIDAVWES